MNRKNLEEAIGFTANPQQVLPRERLLEFVNLKLAARGFAVPELASTGAPWQDFGRSLLANFEEKFRLFGEALCPADRAIHDFLHRYLGEDLRGIFSEDQKLIPAGALNLERHGLARELSLPASGNAFSSQILSSYRVLQGVCHNPAKDRRTTEGVFHVVEGGLPIPADKKSVPRRTFARLLQCALYPPAELLTLPYTSELSAEDQAKTFVSLLLRPLVCPEVPGVLDAKSLEIRFFAPGILVSNLDFVESIFGNAGDPFLPENDARLDAGRWTGHTGCVILAPHLPQLRKKDLDLPHISQATEKQRRDGMCWESEDECYNEGQAFKVACRDSSGVMVTLIADSYYGYCKKEVKTQVSFAANLYGQCEEEHAGGALVFPSFDLGESFSLNAPGEADHTWAEAVGRYGSLMHVQPEGYGIDRRFPDIIYVPEKATIELRGQLISWERDDGGLASIKLLAGQTYVYPSGYKVEMVQSVKGQRWRLVGTQAEGTFCHKPCTVSGGGKSEISKPLSDAMITGPVFVRDFAKDISLAEAVFKHDFGGRFKARRLPRRPSRPLLSPERSFGSVVRMLTPSEAFTDEYNEWLETIPRHVRELVLVIKRRYHPDWRDEWKSRFSVDSIDGLPGIELKFHNQRLVTRYLRVGFAEDGSWRTFSLRKDFAPAVKLQREDDITASVTVAAEALSGLHPRLEAPAYKFATNCEFRLFQRPDDAIIRGYDRTAEADFAKSGQFFSNYEPLPRSEAQAMTEDAVRFSQFTGPMQDLLRQAAESGAAWFVCTANPRLVEGKPSKNPRYLQNRPDLENPRAEYLGELGARFFRRLDSAQPVLNPVHAILTGRRNNPADPNSRIRPLAVYGPVHYQEAPELFMDFIASLTGKSPSTTGAGSEGALTKGPFNALLPILDLNAALLSHILTDAYGYSTAAGHIGRKYRVEHDISILIPEVWSRMHLHERDPEWLLHKGCLEPVRDFTHRNRTVEASRLGYRITGEFVQRFFGRVLADPVSVFPEDMLRPERQSLDDYADGVEHIIDGQKKAALLYFQDGSAELAIPPLKALLHLMMDGQWNGYTRQSAEFRSLFGRQAILESDWYQRRLHQQADVESSLCRRQLNAIQQFLSAHPNLRPAQRCEMQARRDKAEANLANLATSASRASVLGTQPW